MDIIPFGEGGGGGGSRESWFAKLGATKPTRVPTDSDLCRCGHLYSSHLGGSPPGACGFRESVFSDIARDGPSGPQCECKRFEFRYGPDLARLEKVMKDITLLSQEKRDLTLQDIENILRPLFSGPGGFVTETVERTVYVERPAPAEPVQKLLERVFAVKPVLEGRAVFSLDEEV